MSKVEMKGFILFLSMTLLFAGCATEPSKEDVSLEGLRTSPGEQAFYYSRAGVSGWIPVTLYQGVNDYFRDLPRTYSCSLTCPTEEELQARYITNDIQNKELRQMIALIKSRSEDEKERVRIAISLVQRIPYDTGSFENRTNPDRYPYQVLYENKGLCSEKTKLLAYLLKNLGYETAILWFQSEEHSVLGLKCPPEQSYKSTGYCFIETSSPAIPTYSEGVYPGFGRLKSDPKILRISEGKTYLGLGEEAGDAQEWRRLNKLMDMTGGLVSEGDYQTWGALSNKYGIEAS